MPIDSLTVPPLQAAQQCVDLGELADLLPKYDLNIDDRVLKLPAILNAQSSAPSTSVNS